MKIKIGPVSLLVVSFLLFGIAGEVRSNILTVIALVCMIASAVMAIISLKDNKRNTSASSSSSPVTSDDYVRYILVVGKRLAGSFEDIDKLSDKEYRQVLFTSVALIYFLAEKETRHQTPKTQRIENANKLNFAIAHLLDMDEATATQLLTSAIKKLSPYVMQMTSLEKSESLRGSLFWEYGHLIERETKRKMNPVEVAIKAKTIGLDVIETLRVNSLTYGGKTGFGGWFILFIVNVVIFTLVLLAGVASGVGIFVTGDYNQDAPILIIALLMVYPIVMSGLGVWLLILLIKRRKRAIKIGLAFSYLSFNLLGALYLHNSKRVKNTLTK